MDSPSSSPRFGKISFEMLIVVAVLAGLIGTIGAAVMSYRDGVKRNQCVKNIASIQQAVRMYQATHQMESGDAIHKADLIGLGKGLSMEPCCPATGQSYSWLKQIPLPGMPLVKCPHGNDLGHEPSSTQKW